MSLRAKRLLLRLAVHSAVLGLAFFGMMLGVLAESGSLAGFFALAFLGYAVTLRVNPLPRLLERGLFQEMGCSSCGQAIYLVNTWTCGCGFITWEPRHGLSNCPHCKKEYAWLQCPRCEAGIRT
jgi:hypothetical protein